MKGKVEQLEKESLNSIVADGSVVLTKDNVPLSIPTTGIMGMRVTKSGLNYKVNMELVGLTIQWDGDRMVTIEATAGLFNRTAGLCGTLDQSIGNDFTSKDGKLHKVNWLRYSRSFQISKMSFETICSWLQHSSIRGKCEHRTRLTIIVRMICNRMNRWN